MADCDEPQCDLDTDERLLPKWWSWTWPCHWFSWGVFGLGIALLGFGIFTLLTDGTSEGLILGSIALFMMGWCCPNPFVQMMEGFNLSADPRRWSSPPLPPMKKSDWHMDRKYWDEKFGDWLPNPLAKFEQDKPEIKLLADGDGWVVNCDGKDSERFSTPKEADTYIEQKIKSGERMNAQELLFGDHPRHNRYRALYNATPPQFTSRFLFHILSVLFLVGGYMAIPRESREMMAYFPSFLLVVAAIGVIYSHFSYRKNMEAWDTITSIIKYVDGGHGELFGQIRPMSNSPLKILHVDGCTAPSWTFDDLIAWSWNYTCRETWTERYYDQESKTWKTRTRTETRYIRGGSYASDFMVHDGTGGMFVKTSTFERIDLGDTLWERNRRGDKTCGPYDSARHGGTLKHTWSLSALKLSEPVYIMARMKSLPHDDIPRGTVGHNATRVHHTLQAVGEDAPRRDTRISKGTEFAVLSAKNSSTSRLGPLILLLLGSLVMFL